MAVLAGGDKLAKVLAEIGNSADGGLKVGFLEGATYPDGTSVAQVAFWNEYGHGGNFPAPPRPFFRSMIANQSEGWPKKLAAALKTYDYDADKSLSAMGELIKGQLQESISTIASPELSETTKILRKQFWTNPEDINKTAVLAAQKAAAEGETGAAGTQAKPLIWTGTMLNAVDYEVETK